MVLAAVVAGREIGNAGRAVEVDREVEIAFAARRGARDLLNRLHAVGQQAGLQKAMFIQIDVHAGVAQVAIGGNQLRQQGHFLRIARFAHGKADAAFAGVDGLERFGNALQAGEGAVYAADVQIFAKRVAHDADGLHLIAPGLDGIGHGIALLLGLGQAGLPLCLIGAQVDKGGDGAHAHQRVEADIHSSIRRQENGWRPFCL